MNYNKIFGPGSICQIIKDNLVYLYKNDIIKISITKNQEKFVIEIKNQADTNSLIEGAKIAGVGGLLECLLAVKVVGNGPKIVLPDRLNLEAAEHIDLNIKIEDYKQSFDTMIVEFPENYSSKRAAFCPQTTNQHYPIFCIVHKHSNDIIVIGVYYWRAENPISQCFTFVLFGDETIEEGINRSFKGSVYYQGLVTDASEQKIGFDCARASLNILMAIYETGIVKIGPSNPGHYDRLTRRINNTHLDRERRLQASREQQEMPIIYDFKQKVKLYKVAKVYQEKEERSRLIKPHWRRGHKRRQHYGTRNELVKIISIKSVLVNSQYFSGNTSDTSVEYK